MKQHVKELPNLPLNCIGSDSTRILDLEGQMESKLERNLGGEDFASSSKSSAKHELSQWGPGAHFRAPSGVQRQSLGGGPGRKSPKSSKVVAYL